MTVLCVGPANYANHEYSLFNQSMHVSWYDSSNKNALVKSPKERWNAIQDFAGTAPIGARAIL